MKGLGNSGNCEYFSELISLKIDGEISETQLKELEDHLEHCEKCRETMKVFSMLHEASGELLIDPPDGFSDGVMYKIGVEKNRKRGASRFLPRLIPLAAIAAAFAFMFFNGVFDQALSSSSSITDTAGETTRLLQGAPSVASSSGSTKDSRSVQPADGSQESASVTEKEASADSVLTFSDASDTQQPAQFSASANSQQNTAGYISGYTFSSVQYVALSGKDVLETIQYSDKGIYGDYECFIVEEDIFLQIADELDIIQAPDNATNSLPSYELSGTSGFVLIILTDK